MVNGELVTIRMNKRIKHVDHGSVVQMKLAILILIKQTSNIVRMRRRRSEWGRRARRRGPKVCWKKERLVIRSLIKGFAINLENLRSIEFPDSELCLNSKIMPPPALSLRNT